MRSLSRLAGGCRSFAPPLPRGPASIDTSMKRVERPKPPASFTAPSFRISYNTTLEQMTLNWVPALAAGAVRSCPHAIFPLPCACVFTRRETRNATVAVANQYTLSIEFSAVLRNDLTGFYASSYQGSSRMRTQR